MLDKVNQLVSINSETRTKLKIRVVTICNAMHSDVWRITSKLVPDFIDADDYFVYVPESEVEFFLEITDKRIRVQSQNLLGSGYGQCLRDAIKSANNFDRYGWYLQQFYKLELVFQEDSNYDLTVIWDADCVPTRQIEILDDQNRLVYMEAANESHAPYFDLIASLVDIKKVTPLSFVIPSFPIWKNMAIDLRIAIENQENQKTWYDNLISKIDFSLRSGLSETELLGTWVTNRYPSDWTSVQGTWERRGQKRFGYARNISSNKIMKLGRKWNLDIISFENWDTRGWRLVLKRLSEFKDRVKTWNHK
jgi:hypothetical protein